MSLTVLRASIQLSVDDKTRHWIYFRGTPRTEQERNRSLHKTDFGGAHVSKTVDVHNGRTTASLTLDDASFELVNCPTSLSTQDFYDLSNGDAKKEQAYYDEVAAFIKTNLQCDTVKVLHHQVRNARKQGEDGKVAGYASGGPHTDASAITGDEMALQNNDDDSSYKRYLYVNLWRSIDDEHPIQNDHLALVDERTTVKPDDYIIRDLFGDGYTSVQYGLNARHADLHKWYYFPDMVKNEAILFKQMDSDWTKPGRICFHMSVNDPSVAVDAPPRQSIEVRCICYWKEADVNSMPTKENMNLDLIKDPLVLAQQGGDLSSASFLQLWIALLRKVPIVGYFISFLLGDSSSTVSSREPYSGKPEDYVPRFKQAVDSYPSWPAFAKSWVESQIKRWGIEKGVAEITKALVQDQMGYQGTKHFSKEQKQEIVDCLLSNAGYLSSAESNFRQVR